MLERDGAPVSDADREPPLEWECCIWRWYERLMGATVREVRSMPSPAGALIETVPAALDRAPWWQVIDREGWCHRQTMYLLQRLEDGLFAPPPADESEKLDYAAWETGADT